MPILLSTLVEGIINEKVSPPQEQGMMKVCVIVQRVDGAAKALRIQMVDKLKKYLKNYISRTEAFNCLCLIDYVVNNLQLFRNQIADIDFIAVFEVLANKKLHSEVIQNKVHEMLNEWGIKYPNELSEYDALFTKYCKTYKENQDKELPEDITSLIAPIQNCIREVQDALANESITKEEYIRLYDHSTKLNCKLIISCKKCRNDGSYSLKKIKEVEDFSANLNGFNRMLNDKIKFVSLCNSVSNINVTSNYVSKPRIITNQITQNIMIKQRGCHSTIQSTHNSLSNNNSYRQIQDITSSTKDKVVSSKKKSRPYTPYTLTSSKEQLSVPMIDSKETTMLEQNGMNTVFDFDNFE